MKIKDSALKHMDLLMWNVDHPTGLTNITAIMFFKSPLDIDKVSTILDQKVDDILKFKERVVMKNGKPVWHYDELFDIKSHVHRVALPGEGNDKALMEMVSDLISTPLDYTKPLWQIHIIENYKGGSALLWRIHHAIGDGASLVTALLGLTDFKGLPNRKSKQHGSKKSFSWNKKWKEAIHISETTLNKVKGIINNPKEREEIIDGISNTYNDIKSIITASNNSNSIYKGELGVQKLAAWSKEISLSDIKKISKHYNVKVNDTLLAILSGALRRHMEFHHQDTNIEFNIACPVDMRQSANDMDLGNKVGAIVLNLPIDIVDVQQRMKLISDKTSRLKKSLEPSLAYYYTQFISDFIPKKLELYSAKILGSKIMALLSNVPGPKESISFAGEQIENIMFWLPHTYSMGMALSVLSYNNKVMLGITVDSKVIKDPEKIVSNFELETEQILLKINS